MSQPALRVDKVTRASCSVCYKTETKTQKFQRCGKCKKQIYCSKECQTKDWPLHKTNCAWQGQNRAALPARGTEERDALGSIKKWFAKHTRLLVYSATHAMQLQDPAYSTSLVRTHIFAILLDEHAGRFVFQSAGVREMQECGLDEATCTALRDRADQVARESPPRNSLTMYVRSGSAIYLAPITIPRLPPLQHMAGFGPPDKGWLGFLERAINGTLEESDKPRVKRLDAQM
ncbi:hypothetical protein C8F01DRAFT_780114 [Mycena amicta]|nr:hypothetical protein C8F01DRAFT_780114 [Mycena amicta]